MPPRLKSYTFYQTRPDFVSNHTIFSNWVLVAPESGQFCFETDRASGEAGFGDLVLAAPGGRFNRFALSPLSYHVLQFEWADEIAAHATESDISETLQRHPAAKEIEKKISGPMFEKSKRWV